MKFINIPLNLRQKDRPRDSSRHNEQRRPLTAIANRSFWNGVSEIKDVFAAAAASASNTEATAQFYIRSAPEGERVAEREQEEYDEAVANDRELTTLCLQF